MDSTININPTQKTYLHILICLVLATTTLIVYWNVGEYEFINFDDNMYVWNNNHVQKGLTQDSLLWAFKMSKDSTSQAYWHPLTWISHMMDCQLFGLDAGKHHLVNLTFHIINSLLLYLVFHQMTGAVWKSAFLAALFAMHPLNVDSVAWIAERKNLLSTLFWLLTMIAYAHYSRYPSLYRYLIVFAAMIAGLLCKPMLVTLPCVFLLLDFWPLRRWRLPLDGKENSLQSFPPSLPSRLILEKIPLLVLSFLSIITSMMSLHNNNQIIPGQLPPMSLRFENAVVSFIKYIAKLIWPQNMSIYYPFPEHIPFWQVTGALLLLAAASGLIFLLIKKAPYLLVGWLWFIGTLTPVIGIVQGGLWPEMADRWTYVPAIGIFIMISWGGAAVIRKYSVHRAVTTILVLLPLILLGLLSKNQVSHWENSVALFSHALKVTENNAVARFNLAEGLAKNGSFDDAIPQYHEALRLNPNLPMAHNNLGNIFTEKGQTDKAIKQFRQALALEPGLIEAHINLGRILGEKGKSDEAMAFFEVALQIDPNRPEIYEGMGKILARQKLFDQAIQQYHRALEINPRSTSALNNIGNALAEKGSLDEAIDSFNQALKIDPSYTEVHNNLGNALVLKGRLDEALYHYETIIQEWQKETLPVKNRTALLSSLKPMEQVNLLFKTAVRFAGDKNYHKAITLFRQSLAITPHNPLIYYNISCLYAIQNQKAEAVDWLRQAIDHGYDKWDKLMADPDLDNIKDEPAVRKLVGKRKNNQE